MVELTPPAAGDVDVDTVEDGETRLIGVARVVEELA
jgi:hypothetical protein